MALLPRDPQDALTLENDIVGLRLWGPPNQPTLSLGRADIWDRRWFAEKQRVVTAAEIRERAMNATLAEIAPKADDTIYDLYSRYDFPCPKPGAQLILGAPFADTARVERRGNGTIHLKIEGKDGKIVAAVWVSLVRPLVVISCRVEGSRPEYFWARVYRHRDTILPGQPVDPTIGGKKSTEDFQPLPAPRAFMAGNNWGILQDFFPDPTFPNGFTAAVAATIIGTDPDIRCVENELGLGTALFAEREGRLQHMAVKRYEPINQSPGAAATATFSSIPDSFAVFAAIVTTQDCPDCVAESARILDEARAFGLTELEREQREVGERMRRKERARACIAGGTELTAPALVFPKLRRPEGYYGDVPLCSVGSTKLWFQDAGLWHNDFHFNEIRAERTLALGMFPDMLPYCEMIHTLLPQAVENAREVYGLPGAMYPLVHFPLRCRGVAHTNLTWEQDMGLNGLVCKPLWLYYRYAGDLNFLRDLAYPVLRACARFYRAYLSAGQDGYLHIIPTVSPEHWGLTANFERNRDGLSALTLTKYLLKAAAQAAKILGVEAEESAEWMAAAARLAPYPIYQTNEGPVWVDVSDAPPIEYNIPVPLAAVFWGDDVGLDSPPDVLAIARRTLEQIKVWQPHSFYLNSCIRPRLGIWCDGMKPVPESFLLSYQTIHIFPCVPPTGEIVMENFAAEGGFLVSAVRNANGRIEDVRIFSRLGGACCLANPWPECGAAVAEEKTGQTAAFDAGRGYVEFATQPNCRYYVRRPTGLF